MSLGDICQHGVAQWFGGWPRLCRHWYQTGNVSLYCHIKMDVIAMRLVPMVVDVLVTEPNHLDRFIGWSSACVAFCVYFYDGSYDD